MTHNFRELSTAMPPMNLESELSVMVQIGEDPPLSPDLKAQITWPPTPFSAAAYMRRPEKVEQAFFEGAPLLLLDDVVERRIDVNACVAELDCADRTATRIQVVMIDATQESTKLPLFTSIT